MRNSGCRFHGSLVGGGVAVGAAAMAKLGVRDDAEQEQVDLDHAQCMCSC
jgi:hypothetical protein